jgi:hypothetical protein
LTITVVSRNEGSETEVCNLKVEEFIKEEVLWLEISMSDTLIVAVFKG